MIPQSNKPTIKKSYELKGCTFNFVKKGNIVTMSATGAWNESLVGSTFYDLQLDDELKPAIEINDSFACGLNSQMILAGMFRITTSGLLRVYPWGPIPNNYGIRYSCSYVTEN